MLTETHQVLGVWDYHAHASCTLKLSRRVSRSVVQRWYSPLLCRASGLDAKSCFFSGGEELVSSTAWGLRVGWTVDDLGTW